MTDSIITIIPLGEVSSTILEFIEKTLEHTFNVTANIVPWQNTNSPLSKPLYGGKYNSTSLLMYLSERIHGDTLKLLAITEADLYSPIFSCMFGEAQLGGACALVSLHRLRQEYYNLAPDRDTFLSRCEKEVIHEMAHTFGLLHCSDKNCIMYPSSNIIDTDVKSNSFCPNCAGLLHI